MYTLSDRARDGEPARIGAHCGTSVNGTVNADKENNRNRPITVPRSARVPWDQQLRQSSHREVSLPAWVRTGLVLSDEDHKFCCVSRDRFYVPSLCISWDGQVVRCLKKKKQIEREGYVAGREVSKGQNLPPSQIALRASTSRMGSFAMSSIALSGLGCSSMMVCSNCGPDWPAGRGR
jgi:hypothetical protein